MAVRKFNGANWVGVALDLGEGRTGDACRMRWRRQTEPVRDASVVSRSLSTDDGIYSIWSDGSFVWERPTQHLLGSDVCLNFVSTRVCFTGLLCSDPESLSP